MKNAIILTFIVFILVICFWLLVRISAFVDGSLKLIKNSYEKPDTTIIIKNGKSDTIVKIKPVPEWLK